MGDCNHNCESCDQKDCSSRDLRFKPHANTKIKQTIGIVSAKGGVGKSLITSLLAIKKSRENKKVAILDADVTGPSIPKSFSLKLPLSSDGGNTIYPAISTHEIKIVSASCLLEDNTEPILWRGPVISSLIRQFYCDVDYGELDYLFIDMPPGTGDVSLTVFQSLNVDGIIIVTTPQDLVTEIVSKAIEMANKMNIKILGVVENMSYIECPNCKEQIFIFGKSHLEDLAKKYNLKILGRLPIDPEITKYIDEGKIEEIPDKYLKINF